MRCASRCSLLLPTDVCNTPVTKESTRGILVAVAWMSGALPAALVVANPEAKNMCVFEDTLCGCIVWLRSGTNDLMYLGFDGLGLQKCLTAFEAHATCPQILVAAVVDRGTSPQSDVCKGVLATPCMQRGAAFCNSLHSSGTMLSATQQHLLCCEPKGSICSCVANLHAHAHAPGHSLLSSFQ
jgi:hypothetical protein